MDQNKQHVNLSNLSMPDGFHIAFIQPEDGKERSQQMLMAYELCQQHAIATWLTLDENTQINKKNIFVCQDFSGNDFEKLKSSKARIFGPQYIITYLKNEEAIPITPHPIYTATMRGLKICCSSISQQSREDIHKKIQLMGGIVHRQFTEVVTHLVVGEVGSKKYHVACSYNVAVMVPEWVQNCWEVGKEEIVHATDKRFNEFRCPIFKGLNITVSQLEAAERKKVQDIIQCNGDKYQVAIRKNIHCVKPSWLYESIKKGFCLDADLHKIEAGSCAVKNLASTPRDGNNACLPDISCVSGILIRSGIDETAASRGGILLAEDTSTSDSTDNTIALKPNLKNEDLLRKLESCNYHSSGLFLDGCKIMVSGFRGDVMEKLRKILNAGGATRFNQISDAVSHVILGDEVDEHRKALLEGSFRPHVVSIEWLLASVSAGRPVDETNFCCLDLNSKGGVMSPFSKTCKPFLNDSRSHSKCLPDKSVSRDLKLNEMDDVMSQYLSDRQEETVDKLFSGLVFMVFGFNEEETEEIKCQVVENGGTLDISYNGHSVDFAVMPIQGFSVPVQAVNIVTNFWVVTCIELEALQDVSTHPFFSPVPVNTKAQPLKGCVLSVSQHSHQERDCIIQIAKLLGAKYQEYFSRNNHSSRKLLASTHLIAMLPEGSKYEGALKWGLPVVSMQWLLKCAELGCKLDEEPFTIGEARRSITETKSGSSGNLSVSCLKKDNEGQLNVFKRQIDSPAKNYNVTVEAGYSTPIANRTFRTPTSVKGYPSPSEKHLQIQERMRTGYQTPSLQLGRVKQLLQEDCDKPADSSSDSPGPATPSKFLDPNVNFRCQINIRDSMAALDSPLAKNATVDVSPSSNLPMKDLFELKVKRTLRHTIKTTGGVVPHRDSDDSLEDDYLNKALLFGVVIVVSKKLSNRQHELNNIAEELGGKYRWKYDRACTHFIHQGKSGDLNQELKLAKEEGKRIVSPEWLYACREKQMRVEEHLYPYTYNPQLLLDVTLHKDSPPASNKIGISSPKKPSSSSASSSLTESSSSGKEMRSKENKEAEEIRESVSRKIDELLAAAKVAKSKRKIRLGNGNSSVNSSAEGSCRKMLRPRLGKQDTSKEHLDEQYESVPITWDDPTSRLECERLAAQLAKDSQTVSQHFNDEVEAEEIEGGDNDLNREKLSAEEKQDETSECQKSLPRVMLAGFRTQQRQECAAIVRKLGGILINSESFDSSCTHLIVGNPCRSEKYLASIASGKWILEMAYIKACENAGHFVEEEDYEWGREEIKHLESLNEQQHKLAKAAHRWRINLQQKRSKLCKDDQLTVGAFQDWKVIVCSNKVREESFKRLLEAGSAKFSDAMPPFSTTSGVTHAFLELSHVELEDIDLTALVNAGTTCLKPEYIGHFLCEEQVASVSNFYIPEVLPLLKSIQSNNSVSKRNSDETCGNSKRLRQ